MLVLLKFFCQIISVDAKSLVTSFNILELHFKLLGFNILGMNHGPTVLQFLMNLLYHEVLLLQLGYFQLLVPKFFTKCFLVKYGFLQVHLKILDVILQILAIHHLRLKLHLLLIDAPSASTIQSFRRNACLTQHGDNSISGNNTMVSRV